VPILMLTARTEGIDRTIDSRIIDSHIRNLRP
jgi:DNA-binding response OmpR family regulator